MRKNLFITGLVFLGFTGMAFADHDAETFFKVLKERVGTYHQASVSAMKNLDSEPRQILEGDENSTYTLTRLSDSKYVATNTALANENGAGASISLTIFELKDGKVELTHISGNHFATSYRVIATVDGLKNNELHYYLSEATYLDTSEAASKLRKLAKLEEKLALTIVGLVLGVDVNFVTNAKSEVMEVHRFEHRGIVLGNIYHDPRGISELNPKGTQALVVLQAFHD